LIDPNTTRTTSKKSGLALRKKSRLFFFLILRWRHIQSTQTSRLNLPNSLSKSWTPLGLTTLFFQNYYLFNDMITKTDSCKIEHQPNDRIFIWNYNNLIKKPDINYEYKFKINKILRIKIKKNH
jgi:hypothetical protein